MRALDKLKVMMIRRRLTRLPGDSLNPLEDWMVQRVKSEFKVDESLRSSLGLQSLDEVDRETLTEYQLHKLRASMAYVEANSVFYRDRFKSAGVRPEEIREYSDLTRIPLTDPSDLASNTFRFLNISQSKVERIFSTSGTSGVRKRLFYSRQDVLGTIDAISSAFRMFRLGNGDTLQIMFPTVAQWDPGEMLAGACYIVGFNPVICDSVDVDEQIATMRHSSTTALIGLTSFIHRITVLARDRYDLRSLGIRCIICSAEPLPESMRRELEEAWGCKALSQYGMTEMGLATAVECFQQDGLHTNEGHFLFECIDPETGEQCGDREEGELIITSFNYEATPLIRYRTRDLSSLIHPPCSCGAGFNLKIGKVQGRLDMMTKLGFGKKVYPMLFDEAILGIEDVIGYQAIIDQEGYQDMITFRVEVKGNDPHTKAIILEALEAVLEIREGMDNDLLATPTIEILRTGELEWAPKTQAIIDRRNLY